MKQQEISAANANEAMKRLKDYGQYLTFHRYMLRNSQVVDS